MGQRDPQLCRDPPGGRVSEQSTRGAKKECVSPAPSSASVSRPRELPHISGWHGPIPPQAAWEAIPHSGVVLLRPEVAREAGDAGVQLIRLGQQTCTAFQGVRWLLWWLELSKELRSGKQVRPSESEVTHKCVRYHEFQFPFLVKTQAAHRWREY